MNTQYTKRLKRVLTQLKKEDGDSALLLSSATELSSSRDDCYPFLQQTDFYYLTGSCRQDCALLVTSKCDRPILFAIKDSDNQILWEGAREDPKEIASRCGAELVLCQDITTEILPGMNGINTLYYQNIPNTVAWNIAKRIMAQPSWERGPLPCCFKHSDTILTPMRLIKDSSEIAEITKAIKITGEALHGIKPLIVAGSTEAEIAAALDYNMAVRGATPSFKSIVAAGKSASVLHYTNLTAPLKNNQFLMIDCGARYNMYCSDITRTFPIGGKVNGVLADLYSIVLASQKKAIKTVKAGVKMKKVYLSAVKVLVEGLKDLNVLKGDTETLIKNRAYLPYFPHSIGHSLGLDVHDVGRLSPDTTLEKGMVITIEPGLYFSKAIGRIPSCGIRIEDDVLVTKTCGTVLGNIPKELDEL